MNIQLRFQNLKKLEFSVGNIEGQTINLESTFNFEVHYSEDNGHALSILNYYVKSPDKPENLQLSCTIQGRYDLSDVGTSEDKRLAHVKAYELLFPYAQGLIAETFVKAGFPPFMVEMSHIRVEDVK